MDDLADAIYDLGPRGTIEIKQVCEHEKTWNDHGIRTCENCGQQLEVTSYRD